MSRVLRVLPLCVQYMMLMDPLQLYIFSRSRAAQARGKHGYRWHLQPFASTRATACAQVDTEGFARQLRSNMAFEHFLTTIWWWPRLHFWSRAHHIGCAHTHCGRPVAKYELAKYEPRAAPAAAWLNLHHVALLYILIGFWERVQVANSLWEDVRPVVGTRCSDRDALSSVWPRPYSETNRGCRCEVCVGFDTHAGADDVVQGTPGLKTLVNDATRIKETRLPTEDVLESGSSVAIHCLEDLLSVLSDCSGRYSRLVLRWPTLRPRLNLRRQPAADYMVWQCSPAGFVAKAFEIDLPDKGFLILDGPGITFSRVSFISSQAARCTARPARPSNSMTRLSSKARSPSSRAGPARTHGTLRSCDIEEHTVGVIAEGGATVHVSGMAATEFHTHAFANGSGSTLVMEDCKLNLAKHPRGLGGDRAVIVQGGQLQLICCHISQCNVGIWIDRCSLIGRNGTGVSLQHGGRAALRLCNILCRSAAVAVSHGQGRAHVARCHVVTVGVACQVLHPGCMLRLESCTVLTKGIACQPQTGARLVAVDCSMRSVRRPGHDGVITAKRNAEVALLPCAVSEGPSGVHALHSSMRAVDCHVSGNVAHPTSPSPKERETWPGGGLVSKPDVYGRPMSEAVPGVQEVVLS
eukprot:jgi/Ulvmu1/8785/UM048_0040.1